MSSFNFGFLLGYNFLSPGQKFTMRLLDVGNRDLYGKL
jgi:hypothetical protein